MLDFMSILVKRILKTLLKVYDGFCGTIDFLYVLFVLVKRSPGDQLCEIRESYIPTFRINCFYA